MRCRGSSEVRRLRTLVSSCSLPVWCSSILPGSGSCLGLHRHLYFEGVSVEDDVAIKQGKETKDSGVSSAARSCLLGTAYVRPWEVLVEPSRDAKRSAGDGIQIEVNSYSSRPVVRQIRSSRLDCVLKQDNSWWKQYSCHFSILKDRLSNVDNDGGEATQSTLLPGDTIKDSKSPSSFSSRSSVAESISESGRSQGDDGHQKVLKDLRPEAVSTLGWSEAGWTREEVWNWPNAISMARLFSGPVVAWMIIHEHWNAALVGVIAAGISDWLDGYLARRMRITSVLGSYLDPVADKVLVGSIALSMAFGGLLHPALVALVVGRDGALVGGAFLYRAHSLQWQWTNWREFFRIDVGGAEKVQPLFVSKVNTVLQLLLIGTSLVQHALSVEDVYLVIPALSWSVAGTTVVSGACYFYQYWKNPETLAALKRSPPYSSGRKS